MFFWNSLAFSMIQWMLAIWSLVPMPFLNQLEHLEVHGSRPGYIKCILSEAEEDHVGPFWEQNTCPFPSVSCLFFVEKL